MIYETRTVRCGLLKHREDIISNRGDKALWIAGDLIASGDREDLPSHLATWIEVSERDAYDHS